MEMTRKELRKTRKELSTLKKEWMKFKDVAKKTGKAAAKSFGKNFKSAAVFTLKEFSRGALNALGDRWARSLGMKGKKGGKNFGKKAKQAAKQELNAGGGIAQGIKLNMGAMAVVGAAGLAAAAVAQFKDGLDGAIEGERLQISFNALSADGAGGERIFQKLRSEALRTGVEIADMASSIQRFMALNFAEEDAIQLNKSLLDIAGSLGMTNTEAALLGSALAQVKAKGVASMEELRQQIAEKGVPVFQMLAEKLGKTEGEIIKMVSAGKIGADTVIEAFQNLEGPLARFEGGSERMGKSAGGLFARIKQHALDVKRIFVSGLLPELKPFLEDRIEFLEKLKKGAAEWGAKMGQVIGQVKAMFTALNIAEVLALASLKLQQGFAAAFDVAARGAVALVKTLQDDSFATLLQRAALTFKETMLKAVSEIFASIAGNFGGKIQKNLEASSRLMWNTGDLAAARREHIESESAGKPGVGQRYMENYRAQGRIVQLGKWEKQQIAQYEARIRHQRKVDLAKRKGGDEDAPTPSRASKPTAQKSSFDPTAGVASGLANAISRITGGGAIIMDKKKLDAAEGTRKAAEETAKATKQIAKNTKKPRGGDSTIKAQLVLG